jgi:hypothetical protein
VDKFSPIPLEFTDIFCYIKNYLLKTRGVAASSTALLTKDKIHATSASVLSFLYGGGERHNGKKPGHSLGRSI